MRIKPGKVATVSSIWLNAQFAQLGRQSLGAKAFGLGLLHQLLMGAERLAIGSDDSQVVWPFSRLEPNSQTLADMAVHLGDLFQPTISSPPADQHAVVRVVDVVFLNPIFRVELKLPEHSSNWFPGERISKTT